MIDPEQRAEKIDGIITRFRAGEFSADVFTASLKAAGMSKDEIDEAVAEIVLQQRSAP